MAWVPGRSALVTLGGSGRAFVWARIYRENWSAFAPDFTELDENQARTLACATDHSLPESYLLAVNPRLAPKQEARGRNQGSG